MRSTIAVALVLLTGLLAAGCGAARGSTGPIVHRAPRSARSHIVLLVMENEETPQVIGSPQAPYLTSLAHRYAWASRSYGVRHPSLPNYLALVSGSTQGITGDCTACRADARNLADQLEHAHRTWGAYLEGLPRPCARPAFAGRYAKKHDPFAYDDAIARDPARCRRRQPLTRLDGAVRRDRLPDFAFIAPDLCHDTHDCPVATGDRFLHRLVPGLIPALGPHGFLIITYDEGSTDAGCCHGSRGGRIPTVVIGPTVRSGARSHRPVDHYGVLATMERAFGLPLLGAARHPVHGSLDALFDKRPHVRRP